MKPKTGLPEELDVFTCLTCDDQKNYSREEFVAHLKDFHKQSTKGSRSLTFHIDEDTNWISHYEWTFGEVKAIQFIRRIRDHIKKRMQGAKAGLLLSLLLAASAFAQRDHGNGIVEQDRSIWWAITNHTDNLNDATWRTLIATPINDSYVLRMEVMDRRDGSTNRGSQTAFAMQIRSEVVTNWSIFTWPYQDMKKGYTMSGTIVSNVIAWVTWKGALKPLIVESTPLGFLSKSVTQESKEVETVSPVTWYGTNGHYILNSITNFSITNVMWITNHSPWVAPN